MRLQAAVKRVAALIDHFKAEIPNSAIIDAKQYATEDGTLRWFIESRGVNDAENVDQLIICGEWHLVKGIDR